ncbi:MAG TPA: class I SAM-dependent methyltransferase [Candidatus Kapabacteria bacterium]|jgi:2-polyprenyl-3-methyl-5-hydroxy-6-metoxy-1,4-benzoquinol methylase|nr:class I SAM-dependent methyltransferase [Candidatus Kapabacteria bacterium]
MENFDRKSHWENIYRTKQLDEVSWYQPTPETSLHFLEYFSVPLHAKIIDIGGGDSFFVDYLLDKGYQNITVLDISQAAIERAQQRLGEKAIKVQWIVKDITQFEPMQEYDFWHDRAAFHFLNNDRDIAAYLSIAQQCLSLDGIMVIGTFSDQGPKKCSGIEITQYSESSMTEKLSDHFQKIHCLTVDHTTPFETIQNFIFCSFRKLPKQ